MRISFVSLALMLALAPTVGAQGVAGPSAAGTAAAHFAIRVAHDGDPAVSGEDWYFLRGPSRIEAVRPSAGVAEVWERDDRGDVSLKRVFHADRRIVEYVPGELRARRTAPTWAALESVIDPRLRDRLTQSGTVDVPQGKATIYRGTVGAVTIELWWLPRWSLPARMVRQVGERTITLSLTALHTEIPAGWPRIDNGTVTDYLVTDVADLGDMHKDPFVTRLLRLDTTFGLFGGGPTLAH